jgi:hypothetical protein
LTWRAGGLGLLLALLCGAASGDAQVRVVRRGDDRLRGIQTVDIVVRTPAATTACTVPRATLQDASVSALREAGLRATLSQAASSWFYTVEIELETLIAADRCVTSLTAELVAHVDGLPEADRGLPGNAWGSLLVGTMRLIRESGLIASSATEHAARATVELRDRLTAMGARIRKANAAP